MVAKTEERPLRVGLISLGCAKNLVDAEIMLGNLLQAGIQIINDAAQAEVLIVNTCSFIDSAQEESVDTILESAEVREAHNRGQALIVAGCLPQRFRTDLPKLLPEVDAFMGVDQVPRVAEIVRTAFGRRALKLAGEPGRPSGRGGVTRHLAQLDKARPGAAAPVKAAENRAWLEVANRPSYIPDYATPRFRLTPRHLAYVKIAEGCNHPCSFCIIPRMRGSHRSRQISDVIAEARALVRDGVKELNLISQDSTYYGMDLRANHSRAIASPQRFKAAVQSLPGDSTTLARLLRELNAIPGDFWVRLLYTHPAHWTDDLIHTIAQCQKVARYVDIPLQHIHDNMLERMRRETSREYIVDLLRRMRAGIPGIALRTTFIVGFPGETEEYFESLLDFIRGTRFERLGVFTYSREEGTRAAAMAGQVADTVKQRRLDRAMQVQREIAAGISDAFVGRTLQVLVEKEAGAAELKAARVASWEHGSLRTDDQHPVRLRGRYLVARGHADAPDIDGRVYVRGHLPLGAFASVKVVGHTDYDLIAEPIRVPSGRVDCE
jgi:ribosomal protein S12 methylthiotransferase